MTVFKYIESLSLVRKKVKVWERERNGQGRSPIKVAA